MRMSKPINYASAVRMAHAYCSFQPPRRRRHASFILTRFLEGRRDQEAEVASRLAGPRRLLHSDWPG